MSSDEPDDALTSRVTEALARDLGKGFARLDPSDIARLGLKVGDVVELSGRRTTVGKLMPTYSAYRGRGRIQIDGVTRENADATIDQPLRVRPTASRPADVVGLAPLSQPPTDAETRALPRILAGLPVVVGDRVRVNLLGQRAADFKVTRLVPTGPAVVMPSTRLEIGRAAAVDALPLERRSFRPFAYEDVGGLRRELARVREVVELPLRYPEVFGRLGVAPPRGVLLTGPSGCGKTLIARAVAHETEAAFFAVNGPEVIHKPYGEGEARFRDVFEQAARQAPSVIFLDEIDAIADRGAAEAERRLAAHLLTLMDGLPRRAQVVVIAATNRPDALDPALRRPGRFDREIAIPVPDRDARREILDVHRRGMPVAADVDLNRVADATHGFVGADLEALCREAAMACLRRALPPGALDRDADPGPLPADVLSRLEITRDDFLAALREVRPSAFDEVIAGRPDAGWDDVGGLEVQKRRLAEWLSGLWTHSAPSDPAGFRTPRGALLIGPPGCGKTLLARAAAAEAGVHFLAVSRSEHLSGSADDPGRGVAELFHKARHAAPCVVFLDGIDALLPARGTGACGGRLDPRVLERFLAEMDRTEALGGVLVLGATSRPDRLDPALLRPGRFNLALAVPLPDPAAREAIARVALRDKVVADDVDPRDLADDTEGFSGAEVRTAVARAAGAAARDAVGAGAGTPVLDRPGLRRAVDEVRAARGIRAGGAGGIAGGTGDGRPGVLGGVGPSGPAGV